MIYLLALPLTALASALHGWGRFRKGYSFPLLAVLFCALLYADGATHWYAGIVVAAGWRVLFRTGKIAREENGAIQHGDKRDVFTIYWLPYAVTWVMMIALAYLDSPATAYMNGAVLAMPIGGLIHQWLHNRYFNWRVFDEDKWWDEKGKMFWDVRRLSEISGGLFISGIWCFFALLTVAKLLK